MTPAHYLDFEIATSLAAASILAMAQQRSPALLRLATAAIVLALAAAGFADWRRLPSKETPLVVYVAVAITSPLLGAVAVRRSSLRGHSLTLQAFYGVLAFLAPVLPVAILAYYALAPWLPPWLGCCPL